MTGRSLDFLHPCDSLILSQAHNITSTVVSLIVSPRFALAKDMLEFVAHGICSSSVNRFCVLESRSQKDSLGVMNVLSLS